MRYHSYKRVKSRLSLSSGCPCLRPFHSACAESYVTKNKYAVPPKTVRPERACIERDHHHCKKNVLAKTMHPLDNRGAAFGGNPLKAETGKLLAVPCRGVTKPQAIVDRCNQSAQPGVIRSSLRVTIKRARFHADE